MQYAKPDSIFFCVPRLLLLLLHRGSKMAVVSGAMRPCRPCNSKSKVATDWGPRSCRRSDGDRMRLLRDGVRPHLQFRRRQPAHPESGTNQLSRLGHLAFPDSPLSVTNHHVHLSAFSLHPTRLTCSASLYFVLFLHRQAIVFDCHFWVHVECQKLRLPLPGLSGFVKSSVPGQRPTIRQLGRNITLEI